MRQKWNGFMIFGASFVASLSLMLITVMLVLSFSIPTAQQPTDGAEQNADISLQGYLPTEADRKNILLICCKEQSGDPFGYCLISFSPKEKAIFLLDLPAERTMGDSSLNDAYRLGSSEYAAEAVAGYFGIAAPGYLRVTEAGGKEIINAFGKVPVTFLEETTAGRYLFPAGEYRLSGSELWPLLEQGHIAVYLKPMLELALFADRYDEADALFHAITGNADTKVLLKDYYDSKKALRYCWFSADKRIEALEYADSAEWLATAKELLH